ncbi:MAG: SCO family protein [Opitutaceae bacterium]
MKPLPLLLPLLAALALAVAGCARRPAEREFVVIGVVQSPAAGGQIVIQHEEIPGFMPAMTMPFRAREPDTQGLRRGDRVRFRFVVGEASSRATHFEFLGHATPEPAATPAAETPPPAQRLKPGDPVPEFALIDQDGSTVTSSALRGRLTVLTFIFTRCPIPEFCPLLARRFAELQNAAAQDPVLTGVLRLWSITIDPAHDTPEVLRAYGAAQGADPVRWHFLTGDPAELARMRQAFAVHAEPANGGIDHSLATALIDGDGRVKAIWRGNRWTTDEVLTAARAETR